jgi:hypothetical protein
MTPIADGEAQETSHLQAGMSTNLDLFLRASNERIDRFSSGRSGSSLFFGLDEIREERTPVT